jgi:hypothetical protein
MHAHGKKDIEVLMWGKGLLKLLDEEDRLACLRFAVGWNSGCCAVRLLYIVSGSFCGSRLDFRCVVC